MQVVVPQRTDNTETLTNCSTWHNVNKKPTPMKLITRWSPVSSQASIAASIPFYLRLWTDRNIADGRQARRQPAKLRWGRSHIQHQKRGGTEGCLLTIAKCVPEGPDVRFRCSGCHSKTPRPQLYLVPHIRHHLSALDSTKECNTAVSA